MANVVPLPEPEAEAATKAPAASDRASEPAAAPPAAASLPVQAPSRAWPLFLATLHRRIHELDPRWLWGCLAAALLVMLATAYWSGKAARSDDALLQLQGQSHRIALASLRAGAGETAAFTVLEQARAQAREAALQFAAGASGAALSPNEATRQWKTLEAHVDALRAQREPIGEAARIAGALRARSPALQDAAEQLGAAMERFGAGPAELAAAQRLALLTQRIGQSSVLLLTAAQIDPDVASILRSDADASEDILRALLEGRQALPLAAQRNPEVRRQLSALRESFEAQRSAALALLAQVPGLTQAKSSAAAAASSADALAGTLEKSMSESRVGAGVRAALTILAAALACAALASLALRARRARAGPNGAGLALDPVRTLSLPHDAGGLSERDLVVLSTQSEQGAGVNFLAGVTMERRRLRREIEEAGDKVASAADRAVQLSALAADAQRRMRDFSRGVGAMTRALSAVEEISGRVEALAQVGRPTVETIAQASRATLRAMAHMDGTQATMRDREHRIQRISGLAKRTRAVAEEMTALAHPTDMVATQASASDALAEDSRSLAEVSKQIGAIARALQLEVDGLAPSADVVRRRDKLTEDTERALARSAEAAKQLGTAIDTVADDARAQRATLSTLLEQRVDPQELADLAVQWERRGAELALELAQVSAKLERAIARSTSP